MQEALTWFFSPQGEATTFLVKEHILRSNVVDFIIHPARGELAGTASVMYGRARNAQGSMARRERAARRLASPTRVISSTRGGGRGLD